MFKSVFINQKITWQIFADLKTLSPFFFIYAISLISTPLILLNLDKRYPPPHPKSKHLCIKIFLKF